MSRTFKFATLLYAYLPIIGYLNKAQIRHLVFAGFSFSFLFCFCFIVMDLSLIYFAILIRVFTPLRDLSTRIIYMLLLYSLNSTMAITETLKCNYIHRSL